MPRTILFYDLNLQFQGHWFPLKGQILEIFSHFSPVLIYRELDHPMAGSGWTIKPMFDQSSVSWYNRVRSLTTSRNRLNLALLYVSEKIHVFFHILSSFLNFPLINQ